jgi:hypothetical protein
MLVERWRQIRHGPIVGLVAIAVPHYPAHFDRRDPRLPIRFRPLYLYPLRLATSCDTSVRFLNLPGQHANKPENHGVGGPSDCERRRVRAAGFGTSGKSTLGKAARNTATPVRLSHPSDAGADQSTATATTIVQAIADVG